VVAASLQPGLPAADSGSSVPNLPVFRPDLFRISANRQKLVWALRKALARLGGGRVGAATRGRGDGVMVGQRV